MFLRKQKMHNSVVANHPVIHPFTMCMRDVTATGIVITTHPQIVSTYATVPGSEERGGQEQEGKGKKKEATIVAACK